MKIKKNLSQQYSKSQNNYLKKKKKLDSTAISNSSQPRKLSQRSIFSTNYPISVADATIVLYILWPIRMFQNIRFTRNRAITCRHINEKPYEKEQHRNVHNLFDAVRNCLCVIYQQQTLTNSKHFHFNDHEIGILIKIMEHEWFNGKCSFAYGLSV